jgi:hypothetical protein
MKFCNIIIFIILLVIPIPAKTHVQHYTDLKRIEFDIYRNNKNIGKHIFSFRKSNEKIFVDSEINFEIKKMGIVLYKYYVKGTEIYENNKLISFSSKTNQNKKEKYVNIISKNQEFVIEGSSFKGNVPDSYVIGTWWNHSIVDADAQISAVSGRIIKQKVTFLGKKIIKIGNKNYDTLHFNFSSTDSSLKKDKKLNTDVWYDEKTLNWVKASFEKKGKWEYRLISIK